MRVCVRVYLIRPMLLQLLVELEGDADHHLCLLSVGVRDVVEDSIEVWGRQGGGRLISSRALSVPPITND